ncbi:SIS domain-containing protein, partial [Planctomycetota bacterium]
MNEDTKKIISETIEVHRKMTDELLETGMEKLACIAKEIINSLNQNGTIYICGNGGSAADAQHIVCEL